MHLALAMFMLLHGPVHVHPASEVIEAFAKAWTKIQTYTCTIVVHEAKGGSIQDRTYHFFFQKPSNTRAEIVDGDGAGSVGIWQGGTQVHGHQGGFLKFVKLNVDIHSKLATSLRGTTIAQANFGAQLRHLQSLDPRTLASTTRSGDAVLTAALTMTSDPEVHKEVYIFGSSALPTEYFQYDRKGALLKHVRYLSLKRNVPLPSSTWQT